MDVAVAHGQSNSPVRRDVHGRAHFQERDRKRLGPPEMGFRLRHKTLLEITQGPLWRRSLIPPWPSLHRETTIPSACPKTEGQTWEVIALPTVELRGKDLADSNAIPTFG
jgi:hypothetical protein